MRAKTIWITVPPSARGFVKLQNEPIADKFSFYFFHLKPTYDN